VAHRGEASEARCKKQLSKMMLNNAREARCKKQLSKTTLNKASKARCNKQLSKVALKSTVGLSMLYWRVWRVCCLEVW